MNEKTVSAENHGALPIRLAPFVILLIASFGVNAVAVKVSLAGINVFTLAALRFTIASVLIALWAWTTGRSFYVPEKNYNKIALLAVMMTVQLALFFYGIKYTLASRVTLINNLQPFFVMLLANFFIPEDKITKKKILGIILSFTGIYILLQPAGATDGVVMKGDLIILAAVALWSVNTIYTKKIIPLFDPFQIVLYPMIIAAPFYWIIAFIFESPMIFNMDSSIIISVLYQGIITGSFGFVAWNTLLNRYGAVSLHTYVFIMPVAGVFSSWLILGEHLAPGIITTLILVTAGIIVSHVKPEDLFFLPFKKGGQK